MKKHLLAVLIFIIVVPIWTIGWVWADMMKNEFAKIQCTYEKTLIEQQIEKPITLEYAASDLPLPDYQKHLGLIALSISFFVFGGYFFWEYLRVQGETSRKVSFVNQVSHELKTPLTNIRMYAEMLADDDDITQNTHSRINVIQTEVRRLDRIVDNLLAFSRGTQLSVNRQTQNVDDLVRMIAETFKPAFESENIKLELDCQAGEAKIDREILEQILVNLLGNVQKYAPNSTACVKTENRNGKVVLTVSDSGAGIPRHMRKIIFEPFQRGVSDTEDSASGIGIGLPLAANLAKAHGGSLRLLDTGKGTSFEVTL